MTQVARLGAGTVRCLSISLTDDGWRRVEKEAVINYASTKRLKLDSNALQK